MIASLHDYGRVQLASLGRRIPDALSAPWHSAVVRITYWINVHSFLGLLVSGFAILLAHPRFYGANRVVLALPQFWICHFLS